MNYASRNLAPAGTYQSHQRWFLPVLPTTLADSISMQSTPLARLILVRLETTLARLLLRSHPICKACATLRLHARRRLLLRSQAERKALRTSPTGQVRRKESSRCAVSRNERHCAASASHSDDMKGDAPTPHFSTTPAPTRIWCGG